MPTYPNIKRYYTELNDLIQFGGSDNESSIRPAFQNCLSQYCSNHRENLKLIPELAGPGGIPDGTVKDSLRMARGYWEAKDTHDDLDAEIQAKLNQGYPDDNILFEDSQTAVLFQNQQEAMRVDMTDAAQLNRLILRFLNYELPNIEEFRAAQEQFKTDLPTVLENLRQSVEEAEANNPEFQQHAAEFLEQCRQSISPAVSEADVREMLLQHILTQDIFLRVFAEDQFHRENNIASQLTALENTFFTGDVRRQAIDRLRAYYGAIGRAADEIADYGEKQQFLKVIYEDFYKTYNPAAADRLGVVYTPNEIVDFIIRGTDHLLQKHFGRTLADENVQILDPATGTGTFITSLIDYLPADRLEYKYLNEIHANEVAILPYYIANLNIEYSYREKTGKYLEFPNLVFVDTLDNMDWKGATSGGGRRQGSFELASLSFDNWYRMHSQNKQTISVIMGNPPYNANQANFNQFNPNRKYPAIDQRIKDTYVDQSNAQKTKQYDMYKRFVRWASDRLDDDGVIALITNRAYLDSRQDDGFRKVVLEDFDAVYILDLGGNYQSEGNIGNVFGITIGVAIGFFVRHSDHKGKGALRYSTIDDAQVQNDKLGLLNNLKFSDISFDEITPNINNSWLDQTDTDFHSLLPLVDTNTTRAQTPSAERALFRMYTIGVSTNRDEWVYDFDLANLNNKSRYFADTYNALIEREDDSYPISIKWSDTLKSRFSRGDRIDHHDENHVRSLYRAFAVRHYNTDSGMNDRLTSNHFEMFGQDLNQSNIIICPNGPGSNYFSALATDKIIEKKCTGTSNSVTFCFPLYTYKADGDRVVNVTDWGLKQIRHHYRDDDVAVEQVFAYTYAALHDPKYRELYEFDLKQEFPRLPLHRDFHEWARLGQELLDLHIGYESATPWNLKRIEQQKPPGKPRLRADKVRGTITLDNQTTLIGIPDSAWEYRLGSRSALEWILDQYKDRTPRDPTIREHFNTYRFADYKEHVIDLLRRVTTVSVETVRIVDQLAKLSDIEPTQNHQPEPEFITLSNADPFT